MTDWRALNAQAIDAIRAAPAGPYTEGEPIRRVIMVTGRRSGRPRPFAINVTQIGGQHYLCSATRRRDWFRNLMAAGECVVERDGPDDSRHVPVLVEGTEAVTALMTYLPKAGYADPELPFPVDAPAELIAPHTGAIAVVRLDPAG
jgi:hypothetical protein